MAIKEQTTGTTDLSSATADAGRLGRNAALSTKHGELTAALREMIQQMQPGDRLPTQDELMRRFQVSDTTVLRSLDVLKREGRIVRRQGSGTFVAEAGTPASEQPSRPPRANGMVAVLAQPSVSPYFSEMIQAVEANLGNFGMAPVLILDMDVARRVRRAREYWERNEVIGAIHISSAQLDDVGDLPIIMVGETEQDNEYCQVSLDNFVAGRTVGEYLWDLGHREIAVITIQNRRPTRPVPAQGVDNLRVAGIRDFWEKCGGVWDTECEIAHPFLLSPSDSRAIDVMRSYLEPLVNGPSPITAIFAGHDEMALVAIRALEEMGKRVPEDVSVIGFNDSGTLAMCFRPSVTTVRTPCPALGMLAVHLFRELLDNPSRKPRSVRLPAEIIVRESTAPPRSGARGL